MPHDASMRNSQTSLSVPLLNNCTQCERSFSKAEHLRRHQRSHTGEKPYRCQMCAKRYARRDVLVRHMKNHPTLGTKSTFGSQLHCNDDANTTLTPARTPQPLAQIQDCQSHEKGDDDTRNNGAEPLDSVDLASGLNTSSTPEIAPFEGHLYLHDSHRDREPYPTPQSYQPQSHVPLPNGRDQNNYSVFQPNSELQDGLNQWAGDLPLSSSTFDSWSAFALPDFTDLPDAFPNVPTSSQCETQLSDSEHSILSKRFATVERLWPIKTQLPTPLMQTLWRRVAAKVEDGLFSVPSSKTGCHAESWWGLHEDCRSGLVKEYGNTIQAGGPGPPEALGSLASGGPSLSSGLFSQSGLSSLLKFPSAKILDASLDQFFRRFHPRMPFIHRPTFNAESTPNTLLFPMCLIGLKFLNGEGVKKFVLVQTRCAIDKCRSELAEEAARPHQPSELLSTIAAAILLLTIAATSPETAHEERTQLLVTEVLSSALKHELFTTHTGESLNLALLKQDGSDDASWKAWARVESAKRLIVVLIMVDSFYAYILKSCPLIRLESMQFNLLSREDLFEAPSANEWVRLVGGGGAVISPSLVLGPVPECFPTMENEFSIYGFLSAIWLAVSEARHRLFAACPEQQRLTQSLVPGEAYAQDPQAKLISPLLVNVFEIYDEVFKTANPNCLTLWHHLCLTLTADPSTFELAAGRDGAERARKALEQIAVWTQSAAARRACLHAAQVFVIMSRRKTCDGIMLHSEVALLNSALVLGLYLFMMPNRGAGTDDKADTNAFELLGDVDWKAVGCEGLVYEAPPTNSTCAAKTFIRNGGPISFSGKIQRGGYESAQRLFLDYEGLLDDVGKWNVYEYCRILRVMSDCLVETDGDGTG